MNRKLIALLSIASLMFLVGCGKNTLEKRGDEHLENGRLKNALIQYNQAKAKYAKDGKLSEEFHDNHSIALTRMMVKVAKENPSSKLIYSYREAIEKKDKAGQLKDLTKLNEITANIAEACAGQIINNEDNFVIQIEGFKGLEFAEKLAKKHGADLAPIKKTRANAEASFMKTITANTDGANAISKEYWLLLGQFLMPENTTIATELNKSRIKNRNQLLIFQAGGIERPSPLIDIQSHIAAFGEFNLSKTSFSGIMDTWNASGNNSKDFKLEEAITLVSTDGKEVKMKQTGPARCTSPELDKKTFENKENFTAAGAPILYINEGKCNFSFSFSFGSGFVPDHIKIVDKQNMVGRKYLGHK